jgi:hypothetical protein
MEFFFEKSFNNFNLDVVDYWKCIHCGFVYSRKHLQMDDISWRALNKYWHQENNNQKESPFHRHERHFSQAVLIFILYKAGLIQKGKWLDWGCGDGGVALQLYKHFDMSLNCYDPFIKSKINQISDIELIPRSNSLVVNTAVFEHLRARDEVDAIESFVSEDGCFAIHTLVQGEIPKDPDWMYLLPVHSIFFTNFSMQLLMQQWGYSCSIYNPIAKMWVLFRGKAENIREKIECLNSTLGWPAFHFKDGFMDYWP